MEPRCVSLCWAFLPHRHRGRPVFPAVPPAAPWFPKMRSRPRAAPPALRRCAAWRGCGVAGCWRGSVEPSWENGTEGSERSLSSVHREVSMSEMYIYRNVTIERVIQQFWRVWKKSITYLKRDSWCWFRLWNFNSTGDDHAFHFLLITKHLARSFLPHYQVNKKTPIIQLYLLYFQTVNPQPFCLPTTLTPKHSMYGVFTKKNPPNSGKYIHFHWASGTDCPPPAKVDLVL